MYWDYYFGRLLLFWAITIILGDFVCIRITILGDLAIWQFDGKSIFLEKLRRASLCAIWGVHKKHKFWSDDKNPTDRVDGPNFDVLCK
jgi:hypothetical protein